MLQKPRKASIATMYRRFTVRRNHDLHTTSLSFSRQLQNTSREDSIKICFILVVEPLSRVGVKPPEPQRKQYFFNEWVYTKLCENIGIFIKIYKSTNPESNKVVYGPYEQESKEKNQSLDFSICKIVLLQKKSNFLITLLCISKEGPWWVDFRTENQISNIDRVICRKKCIKA